MIIDAVDLMDAINWFTRFDRVLTSVDTFLSCGIHYRVEPYAIHGQMPDKFDQYKIIQIK